MRLPLYKIAFLLLAIAFGYLQYVLWFENDGILSMAYLKREVAAQMQKNQKLKLQNQKLFEQVQRLKTDPGVAEGRARGELGMIKKGEKFYQIVK